jgi:hypothetical protein
MNGAQERAADNAANPITFAWVGARTAPLRGKTNFWRFPHSPILSPSTGPASSGGNLISSRPRRFRSPGAAARLHLSLGYAPSTILTFDVIALGGTRSKAALLAVEAHLPVAAGMSATPEVRPTNICARGLTTQFDVQGRSQRSSSPTSRWLPPSSPPAWPRPPPNIDPTKKSPRCDNGTGSQKTFDCDIERSST